MRFEISDEDKAILRREVRHLCETTQFLTQEAYIQHGNTSVLEHCIGVAYMSCYVANKFRANIDKTALVRGALLHDYFLYDWHDPDPSHRLHGFHHAKTALRNALRDTKLSKKEQNIILRHMFPLTPVPPACKEAWIVCIADKICSTFETIHFSIEYSYA